VKSTKSKNKRVFVDLYIQSEDDRKNNELKLVARFKGPKPAKRAIEQPGFLLDLMHSDDVIYMTTSVSKAGETAVTLPGNTQTLSDNTKIDKDKKTWWRGYARLSGNTPIIFWSLIWPKPAIEEEEEFLGLIMND